MAWPPVIPPNDRTNATPAQDAHPNDHNLAANALTDIVARVNAGPELAYSPITVPVTVTATTAATAQVVINGPSLNLDQTPIMVTFFTPGCQVSGAAGAQILLNLWDANADLGFMGFLGNPVATTALTVPLHLSRRIVPQVGARQYSLRAWIAGGATTVTIQCGTGAIGVYQPAFLRVARA